MHVLYRWLSWYLHDETDENIAITILVLGRKYMLTRTY